mmetsp:Transcript_16383/g.45646  ORF Transcript_16383/g.45646 Transcript_16383/m.45646 type:complete len:320 (-) Transcript_16383:220-1179(-)
MGKKHHVRKMMSKKLKTKASNRTAAASASKKSLRGGAGIHKRGPPPKLIGKPAGKGKGKHKHKGSPSGREALESSDEEEEKPKQRQQHKQKRKAIGGLKGCYSADKRILLVGEGNFSFARALVENLGVQGGSITATAYDTQEEAAEKYPDVLEITAELSEKGAEVRWGVDACDLKKGVGISKNRLGRAAIESGSWRYDVVVFNFPHAGKGIKDQEHNIRANQQLLAAFFLSAVTVLTPDGEVHVTVKTGKPYDQWQVCSLAHRATAGRLQLKSSCTFLASDFPGYAHRRTIGFKDGLSATANEEIMHHNPRTYVWRIAT